METSRDGTATPPDHPAYGVYLTEDAIRFIVSKCLPAPPSNVTIECLHHDKSWNNRIYFVQTSTAPSAPRYVLKLAGRPFRPAEIENEVASLLLLGQLCPSIPTPRVIAWSPDGQTIQQASVGLARPIEIMRKDIPSGWILMTRLEGEALEPSTATPEERDAISKQLAEIVLTWRRNIPRSRCCGNLHFRSAADATAPINVAYQPGHGLPSLHVHGVLEIGSQSSDPLDTTLSFWKHRLAFAVDTLATSSYLAPNRANGRLQRLRKFIDLNLPNLLHNDLGAFVFSHTDLSPRNVLVGGSPLRIVGIVDFEYSGFFPALQEFMGKSVVSLEEDDEGWPVDMFTTILQKLAESSNDGGLSGQSPSTREWKLTQTLMRLETYIAPWWLSAGSDGLDAALQDAREKVDRCLASLQSVSTYFRSVTL